MNDAVRWQDIARGVTRVEAKTVLFVTGAVKSGTTWTQLWLDRHPQIACRGEGYFFNKFAGALQALCREASDMIEQQNQHKGEKLPEFPRMDLPIVQYLLRQSVLSCLSLYGGGDDIAVVGEKTPSTVLTLDTVFDLFPDARVLNVVRDGRDVCISAWHDNLRKAPDAFKQLYPTFGTFLPDIAQIWANHQTPALNAAERWPGQLRQIHYEDLLTTPHETVAATFDWLGVDCSPDLVAACLGATDFRKLADGRKPGEEDRDSFFRKGTASQWREVMTEEQQRVFWEIAGAEMTAQGYSRESHPG